MSSENPPTVRNTTITVPMGWQTRRTLDPVRAAALHEAIRAFPNAHFASEELDAERANAILSVAGMFEAWLEGPERFNAYLAEDPAE